MFGAFPLNYVMTTNRKLTILSRITPVAHSDRQNQFCFLTTPLSLLGPIPSMSKSCGATLSLIIPNLGFITETINWINGRFRKILCIFTEAFLLLLDHCGAI